MGKAKGQEPEVSKNQLKEWEDDISLIAKTGDCEKLNARMGGLERLNAKNYIEVAKIQMQGWNIGKVKYKNWRFRKINARMRGCEKLNAKNWRFRKTN
jgi:hypothetical protein